MRLVDAGKLSLDDSVASQIDGVLTAANGTNMTALFGPAAASVTVRQLIFMQSGLPDFDTPELDQRILQDVTVDFPPYAILRAAASGCAGKASCLHFTPGSHVEYSSTNFVIAGLVLLAHSPVDHKADQSRVVLGDNAWHALMVPSVRSLLCTGRAKRLEEARPLLAHLPARAPLQI